jgi:hypothetical protein
VGADLQPHQGIELDDYLNRAHSAQSGFPPVPDLRFSVSILFPVLQSVLLW